MVEMTDSRAVVPQTAPLVVVAGSSKAKDTTVVAVVPRKEQFVCAVKQAQVAAFSFANNTKDKTTAIVRNPHFQVVTVTTAGGTVTLGAVGGAFGCMGGMVVGSMVGTIPALLTFGMSIPFGGVVGGALGAPAGACVAGVAGAVAGGAAGHGAYVWRAEIKGGVLRIKVTTTEKTKQLRFALVAAADSTKEFTLDRTNKARAFTMKKSKQAGELVLATKKRSYEVVTDKRFQVTTASAVAGAAAGGATGGAVGTVAGAGTGAVVGLPAAIFTFGLSVPICATIGGGIGCVAGATGGGTAGGVAGGAAGYNAHKYRKEIAGGATTAWGKVRTGTNKLKVKAINSVAQVTAMVSGTGGTTGGAGSE